MELVCPACRGALEDCADEAQRLRCRGCTAIYERVAGIPVLVPETTEQHEHQRRYFDAEFSGFAEYSVDNWRESFNRRIFDALGIPGAGRYLDVGVGGSGATVIEAARVGMESVGCDLSVEGVVHAARFAEDEGVAGSAGFVVCAAERLPFPDRSFSCASAVAVLEHLDDDGAAVAELARVLAPGARLWVTVPLAFRYMPPFLWPVYWVHDRRLGHKRHYDDGRLRALLHAHGFEHVRTDYTGHPVKVLQFAASAVSRRVRVRGSRLWWRLEERDLRGARRPLWALQLSMVARRAA